MKKYSLSQQKTAKVIFKGDTYITLWSLQMIKFEINVTNVVVMITDLFPIIGKLCPCLLK